MLVRGLLSLILTHFHSSKALHSDSNIPGSQDPKMNDDLWCVPAQDPALASLKSTFIRCGAKPIFLVLGVDVRPGLANQSFLSLGHSDWFKDGHVTQ